MEWRAIPDFPGYEINQRGIIRKTATGVRYGTRASLSVNGRVKWANGTKLAAVAFAEPAPAHDPEKETLRVERDEALRSLELSRRVNGHALARIKDLEKQLAEAGPKKQGGKRGKRPAAHPACRELDAATWGNDEAPAFDGGLDLDL
jgi:hypothetical protein